MNLFRQFGTDPKLETEGVWLDYGPNSKGVHTRIKVRRAGGANKDFTKALERASKPLKRVIQSGNLSAEAADDLYRPVFVEHCVVGIEGLEDEKGEPLEPTKANLLALFVKLGEWYNDVREQANQLSVFQAAEREADAENSSGS